MFAKNKYLGVLACFLSTIYACSGEQQEQAPLQIVLQDDDPAITRVTDSLDAFEIQILYTQIERDQNDQPVFKDFEFQVNDSTYFYPASTVKFPIAVLTLEKLNLDNTYKGTTRFYVEGDSVETTFFNEVSKIFAVSDNDAYNRLFEFLGPDYINQQLHKKGLSPLRISHRLSTSDAYNVTTKPLVLYVNDSTVRQSEATVNQSPSRLELDGIIKGRGYMEGDSLINEPFDFSEKNYLPVRTLHDLMKRVIFPEAFKPEEVFSLGEENRKFLLEAMHTLPEAAGYDPQHYYDSYGKFFMYGDSQDPLPSHIKIYNKVGYAYGTLTDCAYIVDTKNDIEFLLTATILVNSNGVFNDNNYEYDEIGIPFLAALGRKIYQQELKNRR
ncbi:serine hydrolase [Flavobacteriaceae bacterium M23B6Z8]